MKVRNLNFAKFATYMVLVIGLSASAFASCGDSLSQMAAGRAGVVQSHPVQPDAGSAHSQSASSTIVGLWHTLFAVDGQTIQEAYQLWNKGGTEIHNPNVDPRSGNVCLGVWKRGPHGTYILAHRVWSYDINGNFLGTIHLSETLTLTQGGKSLTGSFASKFYDPSGTFINEVDGDVTGDRISVD
jgi:hypothetical protein